VGDDFPKPYLQMFRKHNINLDGLQQVPGKTFHWSGEYELNMNNRKTLLTELGVFESFNPTLPKTYQKSPFVLLANIAPALQLHVLDQMKRPKFVVADTMDLWLNIAMPELIQLVKRIDGLVLNESEAYQLTKEENTFVALEAIHQLGPKYVIVKKGSHGSILSSPKGLFICPPYPIREVVDPTGAGDSFVGAMMGYLAATGGTVESKIREAMVFGSVVASFCCEGFGLLRTSKLTRAQIDKRVKELRTWTKF
jgi:sugar/nucleoside kinase (ribokinase family)